MAKTWDIYGNGNIRYKIATDVGEFRPHIIPTIQRSLSTASLSSPTTNFNIMIHISSENKFESLESFLDATPKSLLAPNKIMFNDTVKVCRSQCTRCLKNLYQCAQATYIHTFTHTHIQQFNECLMMFAFINVSLFVRCCQPVSQPVSQRVIQ